MIDSNYLKYKNEIDNIHFNQILRNFLYQISKKVKSFPRKCIRWKWQTHFMYHLFSFVRGTKDKRQMLILDVINFVFTSKQSYKFLSIVKSIIYWNATLQYQDEFLCFSRQSNLCYTVFKIFANKQKSFLQVVFDMKTKETHFFLQQKLCSMDEMGR